ncbi:M20 family metallopeptidase [Neolewinella lacunae]|uniref:Amidohydrolase n=1 Tax=Neolewinella lacunae TaxID=1517758 RepID=A0A923T7J7_9BACT|nr:M20 family metallopeptidase [Neolewinella lacunae]MBC6994585.1 amidohydrolase [Neolewinella lacunae]MDN3634457.1 M20 family metallopeptidase [Neolewinella lacunae]
MPHPDLQQRIADAATAHQAAVVADRRHLHAHPELSFQEVSTQRYLASRLTDLGIAHRSAGGTGLIAEIQGEQGSGPTIALRADTDALPIQEANEVEYRSQNPGVMHACGHDVHTASLLGTARIVQGLRQHFAGTVRFLFQPGEELLPGGATLMIRDGALENPRPAAIFGQHVHPPLPAGTVGFRPGIYMASTDELYLTVRGRGGHGAMPHQAVDPVVISAYIITAVQQLISRQTDPTLPAVLTFGRIESEGGATNIIPNAVHLQGTLRTLDEAWRAELKLRLRQLVSSLAIAMGGQAELRIADGYPFLRNDPGLTNWAWDEARRYLGEDRAVELPIRMTGEDFAFYTHHLPACFYRLGVGNAGRGINSPVHTDTFDVDESCLETGTGLMAWLALRSLVHSR